MVGGSFGACIDLRRALTLELGYQINQTQLIFSLVLF